MFRASILLCVLAVASGQANPGECVATSDGGSTCPGSDQTTLLQNRVHLALEAETGGDSELQFNSGPRSMSSTMLQYYKGWAKGAIQSTLDRMVPEEDREPVLMEEEEVVEDFEESQEAELDKLTAARAVEVMASTAAQDCPEKNVISMLSSEFKVLQAEPADSNRVRHVLLQNKDGGLQYLASHQLPNGDHRVMFADPPVCANDKLAALETEATPKPAAGNSGDKSAGENTLLKADDPLVKDCVELLVRTVGEDCQKQVTVKVLTARRKVVDGLAISMHAKVCGAAGCHFHRPECDFEVTSDHTDASLLQQNSSGANTILPEEKQGLEAVLALRVPLCDIDTTDGLGKSDGFDVGLLEQYTFGEESHYKGFEHVYDDYPVVAALEGVASPADLDFRKKYPECYPALAGKKVGTETVRNQGTCGSCWAFAAATATMANLCVSGRSKHAMHHKSDRFEVSVQKILSCKAKGQSARGVRGCNGGNMGQFDKEAQTWGLTKERDNLYKCGSGNPKNHFKKKSAGCGAFPWGGECAGQANTNWWWGGSVRVDGEKTMMSFLASGQSMYISMAVYQNFMRVRDFSIYTAIGGSKQGGHAMNCLGYGKEGQTKYWLIQNSWGPNGWGDQGFARIKRGVNLAGIETGAFVPRVWVEGGNQPKCQDSASGSGISSTGRSPYWSCTKAAKAGYCKWSSVARNCPTDCKSCKAFNGKGTKSPPSPKPSPRPRPAPKQRTGFKNDMLQQHNLYRCMHNVPLFTWSDAIARNAQKYADSTGGKMKHSSRASRQNVGGFSSLGENLAFGGTFVGGVRRWYEEIKNTNKGLVSSFSGGTGHYTQIVWKSSTAIGCGNSGSLLVCQYGEAGNYQGQFDKQVKGPVKSKASCQSGPGPRPSPSPKPAPAPRPKPVPAGCVDRDPTSIKFGCGRNRGKRARCWQLKRHCSRHSFIRKQCCRTCSGGAAPKPKPTPAPTPAPRPTPVKPASVGQITRCSFEDAQVPYCKLWNQANGDQFDWSRGSRTPSCRTGPSRAKDGKRFLYIETSSPRRNGNKAVLRSELVSIGSGASVSFNYHMYGRPGWLKVLVTSQQKAEQVWAQRGNKGNVWKSASVSLKKYAGKDVQIDFVGTKGYGCGSWMGDIAIDNVALDRGASTKKTTTMPPTSPPATTPPIAPKVQPTTMAPAAPATTPAPSPATTPAPSPGSNAAHDALKVLTKRVNKLDGKIDVVLKKVR